MIKTGFVKDGYFYDGIPSTPPSLRVVVKWKKKNDILVDEVGKTSDYIIFYSMEEAFKFSSSCDKKENYNFTLEWYDVKYV